jgi:hypothetical protein
MMALDIDTAAFVQVQATELIAQATARQDSLGSTLIKVSKTLWSGQTVEQDGGAFVGSEMGQGRILIPAGEAVFLLNSSAWLQTNGITNPNPKAVATVETAPKHGSLEALPDGEFRYTPNKNFLGKDFVSFIVDIEGKKIRLNAPLWVVKEIIEPKGQNSAPADTSLALQGDLTDQLKPALKVLGYGLVQQ